MLVFYLCYDDEKKKTNSVDEALASTSPKGFFVVFFDDQSCLLRALITRRNYRARFFEDERDRAVQLSDLAPPGEKNVPA